MIVYDEQNEDGGNDRVTLTREQAIEKAHEWAFKRAYVYRTDDFALEDWMLINGAWEE